MERYGIRDLLPPRYRGLRREQPLADSAVTHAIARSQRFIESQTFEIRRTLWRYASLLEEQRKAVHRRRQAILLDEAPLDLLASRATDRYQRLRIAVGNEILRRVEKQITLFHIDQGWAEHLVRVADIRENIYLVVLGANYDALDEFHKMAGREFADLQKRTDQRIVQTFNSAEITPNGIDLEKEGLTGPASTWTYLINDNPAGDVLQRLLRGLKRSLIKDASGA
jgi:preprotein translocase subunit SecA